MSSNTISVLHYELEEIISRILRATLLQYYRFKKLEKTSRAVFSNADVWQLLVDELGIFVLLLSSHGLVLSYIKREFINDNYIIILYNNCMNFTSNEKYTVSSPNHYRLEGATAMLGAGVLLVVGAHFASQESSPINAYSDKLTSTGECLDNTIYDTNNGAQVYESSLHSVSILNVSPADINDNHAPVLHFTITREGLAQPKLQTADHQTGSYLANQCNLTVNSDLIGS